jgi:hypothetical protein
MDECGRHYIEQSKPSTGRQVVMISSRGGIQERFSKKWRRDQWSSETREAGGGYWEEAVERRWVTAQS